MSIKTIEQKPGLNISRRGFLKASAAVCAVTAVPTVLTGCGKVHYPPGDCLAPFKNAPAPSENIVFDSALFGPIKVKNRLVRSATSFNAAGEYGQPTQKLLDVYADLGKGGVGTIITGMYDTGLIVDNENFREEDLEAHRKVPQVIHQNGAAAIQQISHQGSQLKGISDEDLFSLNRLSDLEIEQTIEHFVKNTDRSKRMGFDGVQLHGGHGYLLSEFLSSAMTRRADKWGGTTENRFRVVGEIIKRSKEKNRDFPIFIKINAYDFQEDGMREPEAVKIAKLLEKAGCDGIEVSCGVSKDGFSILRVPEFPAEALTKIGPYRDRSSLVKLLVSTLGPLQVGMYTPLYNYNVCAAAEVKKSVSIPTMVVGGIRALSDIQTIIHNDLADFVSMGRPFIIEPGIVNSLENGDLAESGCINCGFCIFGGFSKDVKCYYGEIS